MHYFNFLHVPASAALLGILQEEFVRRFDLNLSSAQTRTSATQAATLHANGDTTVAWCNSVVFFLHLLGLCADSKSGLCGWIYAEVDAESFSTYAYIYINTCPRFLISSSTVTHHVSSNTFAPIKTTIIWGDTNITLKRMNRYSTCISPWVPPAPAIWKHDSFYINELDSHEVWNTPYIGWHVQEPGCTRWESAG